MISKQDALDTAMTLYGDREDLKYDVQDFQSIGYSIYGIEDASNFWCVSVIDKIVEVLKSTTIVLVHKKTGEVVYHGDGGDEG